MLLLGGRSADEQSHLGRHQPGRIPPHIPALTIAIPVF